MSRVVASGSPAETREIGRGIAADLRPGDVVLLSGDLGAGKTELTKGIAAGLGVTDLVQSPTFALVDEHPAPALGPAARLLHLDLYRLEPEGLDGIGWDDLIAPETDVVVVEWPERAAGRFPDRYLMVELTVTGPEGREVRVQRISDPHAAAPRAREGLPYLQVGDGEHDGGEIGSPRARGQRR